MLTYGEAIQYIIGCYGAQTKKPFDDLRGVLALLGDPQKRLRVIHVAGTNGKGSVCAMLSSVLSAAGYSVGVFTSPHLARFNERIALNGADISDDDFAALISRVKAAVEDYFREGERLSYFQLLTVAAFLYFAENAPDFVVLEVGLGGRLDSTNVLETSLLSVITSISIDHSEILGETQEKIAFEKAGIIKKNQKTVLYFQGEKVYNVVKGVCEAQNSSLYFAPPVFDVKERGDGGFTLDVKCSYYGYENITLALAGEFQLGNVHTALLCVTALRDSGVTIPDGAVYAGLSNARHAGRMEVIGRYPLTILDGAHNADGAKMFAETLIKRFGGKDVTIVAGVLAGKEYGKILAEITRLPFVKVIILTRPNYAQKALPPYVLKEECERAGTKAELYSFDNCGEAADFAREITEEDGVVFCVGSLYLVGDLREHFLGKRVRQ